LSNSVIPNAPANDAASRFETGAKSLVTGGDPQPVGMDSLYMPMNDGTMEIAVQSAVLVKGTLTDHH